MLEPGAEPDLAEEAIGTERLGQLGAEDLERDHPVMLQVAGEIHDRHAAAAELALNAVAVGQSSLEAIGGAVGQVRSCETDSIG